uniref:class I SAM-dependent methyltransferase n=1 Tax=Thaumasiovibrio occultus TaxID=1891184 RepID=UPI000B34B9F4|nr:class I SAM-dependent methyltransferase [Thaumasiovibrio occultus]
MTPIKANYDAIASHWLKARNQLPAADNSLFEQFTEMLKPNSQLLDMGCGSGKPIAVKMVARGHSITGVDRSKALLAEARKLMPAQTWILDEMDSYVPLERFDGAIMWDSLFHLPRDVHGLILSRLFAALAPGAPLILSSGGSAQSIPAFTDLMFGELFYYDAMPIPELLAYCQGLGWEVITHTLVNKPDGGRDKGRVGIILRKPL